MKKTILVVLAALTSALSFSLRADEGTDGPFRFGAPKVEKAGSHVVPVAEVGLPFYKNIKQYYNYKDYTPGFNDRYDPVGATVASALVPGLGHSLCGEPYRGIYFAAGTTLCLGIGAGLITAGADGDGYYYDDNGNRKKSFSGGDLATALGSVFMLGGLAIWVWNAIDANHVAKTKNLYLRDIMDKTGIGGIHLAPSVQYLPTTGTAAGFTLGVTF